MAGKFVGPPFGGGNEVHGFITPNLTLKPAKTIATP